MRIKTVFLDTSVIVQVASDNVLSQMATQYFSAHGYKIVLATMTLIELYRRPKQNWDDIAYLLSYLPFCIAQNSEGILDAEVLSYPEETGLPTNFEASAQQFSPHELSEILESLMKREIAQFDNVYRPLVQPIWEDILKKRELFLPINGKEYSPDEREMFLQTSVLNMTKDFHLDFLKAVLSRGEEIKIKCFKSFYIQALAIFIEYYVQKKNGKKSDVGDFYQLTYVPYVDLAVLDNERTDLIKRINQTKLFSKELLAFNIGQLKKVIAEN